MAIRWQALGCFLVGVTLSAVLFGNLALARQHEVGRHRQVAQHSAPAARNGKPLSHHHALAKRARPAVPRPAQAHHKAKPPSHRTITAVRPVIVIDPGHGGRDLGAVGRAGTLEKSVTLNAALELKRQLAATGRYRVAMTRTSDVFISLADRRAFARRQHGALFISIHANASKDSRARGASVYVQRRRRGSEEIMRFAAGPGTIGGVADALIGPRPRPGSAWLQSTMIDNLDNDIRMLSAPARDARLYVLGGHAMPSVLLEMGFLSNRQDEVLLKQAKYRKVIAGAIRQSIDDYFTALKHPRSAEDLTSGLPRGTPAPKPPRIS